jgi:hypothetical protein
MDPNDQIGQNPLPQGDGDGGQPVAPPAPEPIPPAPEPIPGPVPEEPGTRGIEVPPMPPVSGDQGSPVPNPIPEENPQQ